MDADKESYPTYYEELVSRLRPGGLVVLDNVLLGGRVFDEAEQGERRDRDAGGQRPGRRRRPGRTS